MPQLNRDILREVFYQIVKSDGSFENIDKFMMAGKEPFNLVLDICNKAKNVVILASVIKAQLPKIEYPVPTIGRNINKDRADDDGLTVTGTVISTRMKLFKPISIALASTITSLDIRGYDYYFIPMLKSIDREMKEVTIRNAWNLNKVLEACVNIPNVQDGVTIRLWSKEKQIVDDNITSFSIPCRKLTIPNAYFNNIHEIVNHYNPHLSKIRDLTLKGTFDFINVFDRTLKVFAAFLSIKFPNLETLNICSRLNNKYSWKQWNSYWNWNEDAEMVNFFKVLPAGVKGCICFRIISINSEVNLTQYPDVQRSNDEYYKIVPITDTLDFKMSYWYNARTYHSRDYYSKSIFDGYDSFGRDFY